VDAYTTELKPSGVEGWWTLRVKTPDGLTVEYHYKSPQQAKFMAAVFALGPTTLPPAERIQFPSRERRKVRRHRARMANVSPAELDLALDAIATDDTLDEKAFEPYDVVLGQPIAEADAAA
jgi:hypothetical protein